MGMGQPDTTTLLVIPCRALLSGKSGPLAKLCIILPLRRQWKIKGGSCPVSYCNSQGRELRAKPDDCMRSRISRGKPQMCLGECSGDSVQVGGSLVGDVAWVSVRRSCSGAGKTYTPTSRQPIAK